MQVAFGTPSEVTGRYAGRRVLKQEVAAFCWATLAMLGEIRPPVERVNKKAA